MSELNSNDFKVILTEQFAQSIKAVAELTRSIQSLQNEVEDHSSHITQAKSELLTLKEKLTRLTRLVQGEGLTDSLSSAVIELQTRLSLVQETLRDARTDKRDDKNQNVTFVVLISSTVVAIITALITIFVPMLFKG